MACDRRFSAAHAQMCRLHLDPYATLVIAGEPSAGEAANAAPAGSPRAKKPPGQGRLADQRRLLRAAGLARLAVP